MHTYRLRELPYQPDTLALFSRLQPVVGSFLLFSGSGFAGHRFDVFSALPDERISLPSHAPSHEIESAIADMIQRLQAQPGVASELPLPGWYGLLAYDLPAARRSAIEPPSAPGMCAGFYPVIFVADHLAKQLFCIALEGSETRQAQLLALLETPVAQIEPFTLLNHFHANMDRTGYAERFAHVQNYLHAGDCYQVNLAQRFSAPFKGHPWEAFHHLTRALPSPMGCFFRHDTCQLLSMSPERFLSIRDGHITTHPIKGTAPRHADPDIDKQRAAALQNSEKDRAENLMIVDLLRNDLGQSCKPGSIRVTDLFAIESYANVHHLVSRIEGQLRPDIHPLKALMAAFPGGSITGAPKKRAMEIIAELEPDPRELYCGSAFYCDVSGKLDSNILIRSLVCSDNVVHCWGGGGIVADSLVDSEYQETLDKVGVILRTLEATIARPTS